nr:MAG TPA: hypothetical protein [Caudoviricetes sp.]
MPVGNSKRRADLHLAMFSNIVAKTLSSKGQLAIKIDQSTCG